MAMTSQATITLHLSPEDLVKVHSAAVAISVSLEDYVRQRLNLDKLPESMPTRPPGRPRLSVAERLKREAERKVMQRLAKWIAMPISGLSGEYYLKGSAARELMARVENGREPGPSIEAWEAFTRYAGAFGVSAFKDMPAYKDFPLNGRDLPQRNLTKVETPPGHTRKRAS